MGKKVNLDIDEAVKWYTAKRNKYELLSGKVSDIIKEVLDSKNIEYYTISSRTKKIDSFKDKIGRKSYNDVNEIKDFSGIRVITYVESEADKVADIVKDIFKINYTESIDKSKELGVNEVGYRSKHYIAKFSSERSKLPEFKQFSGLEFEIQVRTILQHAWAEIEHDRNYKYSGVLPDKIQRRFSIIAGVLELADREFDNISLTIDSYKNEVSEKTKRGDLDVEINSTALIEFLTTKFVKAISSGLEPSLNGLDDDIIKELNNFGIKKLTELNDIIPEDLEDKLIKSKTSVNFLGVIRYIMIIDDEDRYFEKSWKHNWGNLTITSQNILLDYGINIDELSKKYDFELDKY